MSNSRQNTVPLLGKSRTDRKSRTDAATLLLVLLGLVVVPLLYLTDNIDIVQVNMLGRYLCFAIVAVSLDLLWGSPSPCTAAWRRRTLSALGTTRPSSFTSP